MTPRKKSVRKIFHEYFIPYDDSLLGVVKRILFVAISGYCGGVTKTVLIFPGYGCNYKFRDLVSRSNFLRILKSTLTAGWPICLKVPSSVSKIHLDPKLKSSRTARRYGNVIVFFSGKDGKEFVLKIRVGYKNLFREITVLKKLNGEKGLFPKLVSYDQNGVWHITEKENLRSCSTLDSGTIYLKDIAPVYYSKMGLCNRKVGKYLAREGVSISKFINVMVSEGVSLRILEKWLSGKIIYSIAYGERISKNLTIGPFGKGFLLDFEDASAKPIALDLVPLWLEHSSQIKNLLDCPSDRETLDAQAQIMICAAVLSIKRGTPLGSVFKVKNKKSLVL